MDSSTGANRRNRTYSSLLISALRIIISTGRIGLLSGVWIAINISGTLFYSAKQCLPEYEKECPDDKRVRNAIKATEKVLKHDTEENRSAAESAAWAACAARSAWSAARSAESAWSASWPAESAAESAVWGSSREQGQHGQHGQQHGQQQSQQQGQQHGQHGQHGQQSP